GDLGAPAGVQPAAHGDGRRRGREPRRASQGELQGGQAGRDRLRPEDRGGAAGGPGAVDRRAAGSRGLPPRRRPPPPLGAAGPETSAEAWDAPDAASSRSQAATESPEILLS